MTQKYRSIRATIEGEELIEAYEKYKYDNDLTDRELICMALREYFSQKEEYEVYF